MTKIMFDNMMTHLNVMIKNIINHHQIIIKHVYFKPLLAWIIWIISGTVFYCYQGELGWSKGFYMAVNVGYSIGK